MGFIDDVFEGIGKFFKTLWKDFVSGLFDGSDENKLKSLPKKVLKSYKATNEAFVTIDDFDELRLEEAELKHLKEDSYLMLIFAKKFGKITHVLLRRRGDEVMIWFDKGKGAIVGDIDKLFYAQSSVKDKKRVVKIKKAYLKESGKVDDGVLLPIPKYKLTSDKAVISVCNWFKLKAIVLVKPSA